MDVPGNASFSGSRKAYINKNSSEFSNNGRSYEHKRIPFRQLNYNTRKPTLRIHHIDEKLPNKWLLIIDDVGLRMKTDEQFQILCKPATNLHTVIDMFRQNEIPNEFARLVIHVGTNSVRDFRRHRVITEVLQMVQVIRQFTTAWIYISSLVPRPVDHQDTSFLVRDYNHALKKAVQVASYTHTGVKYISNQQLYIAEDGTLKYELFHKKQIALSKAGIACLKNNLITNL